MKPIKMILFVVLFIPAGANFAGEAEQAQMADILISLNHYPDDQEKTTLQSLAKNSSLSDAERTIARALARVEHFPTDEDKKALKTIVGNDGLPKAVRELARITRNLEHKVTQEDKQVLAALTN